MSTLQILRLLSSFTIERLREVDSRPDDCDPPQNIKIITESSTLAPLFHRRNTARIRYSCQRELSFSKYEYQSHILRLLPSSTAYSLDEKSLSMLGHSIMLGHFDQSRLLRLLEQIKSIRLVYMHKAINST